MITADILDIFLFCLFVQFLSFALPSTTVPSKSFDNEQTRDIYVYNNKTDILNVLHSEERIHDKIRLCKLCK
jgi:hypothetical protein